MKKTESADFKVIDIDSITINEGNQSNRFDSDTKELEESISNQGLINPISVNEKLELLCGHRRLRALKNLGYTKAPAMIINCKNLEGELISIDENIIRKNLDDYQLEIALVRRKEIYETLHPETKQWVAGGIASNRRHNVTTTDSGAASFVQDTSRKIGRSKSAIHQTIHRVQNSSDKVHAARTNKKISKSVQDELVKLDQTLQDEVLHIAEGQPVQKVKNIVNSIKNFGIESISDKKILENELAPSPEKIKIEVSVLSNDLKRLITMNISDDYLSIEESFNTLKDILLQLLEKFSQITKNVELKPYFQVNDDLSIDENISHEGIDEYTIAKDYKDMDEDDDWIDEEEKKWESIEDFA